MHGIAPLDQRPPTPSWRSASTQPAAPCQAAQCSTVPPSCPGEAPIQPSPRPFGSRIVRGVANYGMQTPIVGSG